MDNNFNVIESIKQNTLWYIACAFVIVSVFLYSFVLTTPVREYLVLISIIFLIIVVIFKFMK